MPFQDALQAALIEVGLLEQLLDARLVFGPPDAGGDRERSTERTVFNEANGRQRVRRPHDLRQRQIIGRLIISMADNYQTHSFP
jgi:hypothetical protein